jgi:hypothetical protein
MSNPFRKAAPLDAPHAIYRSGNFEWRVLRTYKQPSSEAKDPYARWFVAAKSDATYGSFEYGDTYKREVVNYGRLVAATPAWQEAYGTRLVPTPTELMQSEDA